MNTNERELLLKNEVYQIVGAAMEVSNQLGCGFLEAVYQEALGIELVERKTRMKTVCQYKGEPLTASTPDVKEIISVHSCVFADKFPAARNGELQVKPL